jgi:phage baseplate assembly protein W
MTRRSPATLDRLMRELGTDLALFFAGPSGFFDDGDLRAEIPANRVPRRRDIAVVSGVASAQQLLVNRLMTHQGELAPLGHPEYGSRHHELIGEPNVERTRNLIKLHVLEALSHEPRIDKILSCRVFAPHDPPRDIVRIELDVQLVPGSGEPNPLNLVVPFSLEVGT